ncbi:MAG: penicillin acylase family protein [Deltaproteobacteria bacterium]|nr:penicillin acylase family protein [Deltaproteobacteria bacterium]
MKQCQRGRAVALTFALVLGACGDNGTAVVLPPDSAAIPPGPFDALPMTQDFAAAGLSAPVHAARDKYGIMHINAQSVADLGYGQGYVMAHDRLPQMDILRRFGSGRLAELFGALDQKTIETDLQMRMHRMRPLAEEAWAILKASTDPEDKKIVQLLTRFADGVNAYAADVKAGKFQIDPSVATSFDIDRFVAWDPIDSLVLGRFQAFALSWTTPVELDLTTIYQGARQKFDGASAGNPAYFARKGISADLLHIAPVGHFPTIDGFPNVDPDTGTRSDAGRPGANLRGKRGKSSGARRPVVPREVLDNARDFFSDRMKNDLFGLLSPHVFMVPHAGSNDWAVGPALANGKTLLAGDQHLQMPNPSIFYPTHLTVPGELDAEGVTFPGIPGIILGHNGKAAWQSTVVFHDVNDVFAETIVPCTTGGGDCVLHDGGQVKIESRTETIKIGANGTITGEVNATYEMVPHHGPIIPIISNGHVVPRTASTALSVEYTGYQPTMEIRAVWGLVKSSTVDQGFKALANFQYGGQNWVIIDNQGNIGWTSNAKVPVRKDAAYEWNAQTNPDGIAPFMVMPGDGSADWTGTMDTRYVPHVINPTAGFIATANSDPVGATFDNDPLNQYDKDGHVLYAGTTYAAGVRSERIAERIQADATSTGNKITLDDLAAIQHDSTSLVGKKLTPPMLTALAYAANPTGAPADVVAYVATLSPADKAALASARTLLAGWSFAAPTATGASPSADEKRDSAATALFNVWMHYFIQDTLGDEYAAIPFNVWGIEQNLLVRNIYGLLVEPTGMVMSATTGQPILCDNLTTAGADESCTQHILSATLEALAWLKSSDGYGSSDPNTWVWGDKHRLIIPPLFPNAALNVPPATDPTDPTGFAKAGDNFVVNRADCGWDNLDFHQEADGPAERFLAEATNGGPIKARMQLPGGAIYDPGSPHYRDLLDKYYLKQTHFDLPFTTAEIVAAGEDRWVFH